MQILLDYRVNSFISDDSISIDLKVLLLEIISKLILFPRPANFREEVKFFQLPSLLLIRIITSFILAPFSYKGPTESISTILNPFIKLLFNLNLIGATLKLPIQPDLISPY